MVRVCSARPTAFTLFAPEAKRVTLAGTFNDWRTTGISARRDAKGNWTARINLKPGRYEYKYFVDGNWVSDPNCTTSSINSFGTQNNILEVR